MQEIRQRPSPDNRENVLAFKCNVTPHRPEKGAQHETKCLGIFDPGSVAYGKKPFGYFLRQRFVLDVLHAQTRERFLPFLGTEGFRAEGRIDSLFFKGMRHLEGRKKRLRHPQASSSVDKAGKAVGDRFERRAQFQLYFKMRIAALAHQTSLRLASARKGAGFLVRGDVWWPGQGGLVVSRGFVFTRSATE